MRRVWRHLLKVSRHLPDVGGDVNVRKRISGLFRHIFESRGVTHNTKSAVARGKQVSMRVAQISEVGSVRSCGNSMYVAAHPDDSLLFQSPSILQNIQSNFSVLTVHLTAGDNGLRKRYWRQREAGIEAAYAQMACVDNNWTRKILVIANHSITCNTLTARPNLTVIFLRLPDGGYPDGVGTSRYRFQSLGKLWLGSDSNITAVDGSTSYGKQDLIETLAALMNSFQPSFIAAHDFVNTFGDGDHMDHYAAAKFSRAGHNLYALPHSFVGYLGYPSESLPANVSGELLAKKQTIFYTYGGFDSLAGSNATSSLVTSYASWLQREYKVGSESIDTVPKEMT